MKEAKICLPLYKISYAVCFVVILSLVRGISEISEIGIAMDDNMAILAIVFCGDTYWMEYRGRRWEVFRLYSLERKAKTILRRLVVQWGYLWFLALAGYGLFYWQRPGSTEEVPSSLLFVMFLFAVTVTITFWGTLAMTLTNLLRNLWAGMGVSLALWLTVNSKWGQEAFGNYNVFAFSFRNTGDMNDVGWTVGKCMALLLTGVMLVVMPKIMRKRG